MSDEKPTIDAAPRRYLKSHEPPVRVDCYLGIRKVTLGELREHFAEVDFEALKVGGIQLHWEDEPTLDELEKSERQQRAHAEKHEKWERDTYTRLRAKFEPASTFEMTE